MDDLHFSPDVIVAPDYASGEAVRRQFRYPHATTRVLSLRTDACLLADITYDLIVVDLDLCDPHLVRAALGDRALTIDYRWTSAHRPTKADRRERAGFRVYAERRAG